MRLDVIDDGDQTCYFGMPIAHEVAILNAEPPALPLLAFLAGIGTFAADNAGLRPSRTLRGLLTPEADARDLRVFFVRILCGGAVLAFLTPAEPARNLHAFRV